MGTSREEVARLCTKIDSEEGHNLFFTKCHYDNQMKNDLDEIFCSHCRDKTTYNILVGKPEEMKPYIQVTVQY
jgi:hypothetical protein